MLNISGQEAKELKEEKTGEIKMQDLNSGPSGTWTSVIFHFCPHEQACCARPLVSKSITLPHVHTTTVRFELL